MNSKTTRCGVGLPAADMQVMAAFYRDVLGLETDCCPLLSTRKTICRRSAAPRRIQHKIEQIRHKFFASALRGEK